MEMFILPIALIGIAVLYLFALNGIATLIGAAVPQDRPARTAASIAARKRARDRALLVLLASMIVGIAMQLFGLI